MKLNIKIYKKGEVMKGIQKNGIVIPKEFEGINNYLNLLDEINGVNDWLTRLQYFDDDYYYTVGKELMKLSAPNSNDVNNNLMIHRSLLIATLTSIKLLIKEKGIFTLELYSSNAKPYRPDLIKYAIKTLNFGATKYEVNSWLDVKTFNRKNNHASMFRHLADSYSGNERDHESNLDPLCHLLTRSLMEYTLWSRGEI